MLQPTPMAGSETPLRPLREALRVRLGGQVGKAASFSDGLLLSVSVSFERSMRAKCQPE